ncbi:MAG: ATP-binding protein, partial [Acidobacteriota bacterium]
IDVRAHLWQRGWFRVSAALAGALLVAAMVWTASTFRYARELESEVERRTSDLRTSRETVARDRARLAATLRSITDGVVAADTEGRIVLWNPAAARITGWSADEAVGQQLRSRLRLEADEVEEILGEMARGTYAGSSCTLLTRDGERRQVEISGAPLDPDDDPVSGAVMALRDVTERRRMERNLARAERLEALGILAGGIAHDFNNLLTAILGNVSLLEAAESLADEGTRCLADAREGAERARALTRQLLTFAKGGAPRIHAVSISELLRSTSSFVFRGSPVRGELDLPGNLRPVEADPDQIAQVLENLFLNARQALPDGGTVRITAEDVDFPSEDDGPSGGRPGVRIEVSDDGPGIPRDDLERIFDPYFSTKPDGTGLGLTIAHSIIDKHGGRLSVESTPGSGATFRILLPAARASPKGSPETPTSSRSGTRSGAGRILVMDDEEAIRGLLARMLERIGYECVTTACGEETLRVYEESRTAGRPFDAVILDLTVPDGMGGKETLRRLRERDPDVRAIVASGYSDDSLLADAEAHGFRAAVPKPFDLGRISEALARVLEADEPSRSVAT